MSKATTERKNDFEVGYAKPPVATRFEKGRSGNPSGRPRNRSKTVEDLILQEAFRPVVVSEGGKRRKVPAIKAVLRAQIGLAARGNGPAQRSVIRLARELEDRQLAEKHELLEAAIKYKHNAEQIAWERHVKGLPEDNNPGRPRPEDLIINPQTGDVLMMRRDCVVPQLIYNPAKKPANILDDLE